MGVSVSLGLPISFLLVWESSAFSWIVPFRSIVVVQAMSKGGAVPVSSTGNPSRVKPFSVALSGQEGVLISSAIACPRSLEVDRKHPSNQGVNLMDSQAEADRVNAQEIETFQAFLA